MAESDDDKTPPREVWLQWHGEDLDGEEARFDEEPAPGSVTWHSAQVFDSDAGPYVIDRDGEVARLRSRVEELEGRLRIQAEALEEAAALRAHLAHVRRLVSRIDVQQDNTAMPGDETLASLWTQLRVALTPQEDTSP